MSRTDLAHRIRTSGFRKPVPGQRGYDEQGVDDFLDWLQEALLGDLAGPELATRISHTTFGRPPTGIRGYRPEDVDGLLDEILASLGPDPTP